jgi:hypothetical protein
MSPGLWLAGGLPLLKNTPGAFSNMPKEFDLQRLNNCIVRGRSSLRRTDGDSASGLPYNKERLKSGSWDLCVEVPPRNWLHQIPPISQDERS